MFEGLPERVMVDKGSEWNMVRDVIDVVQMTSVYNQVHATNICFSKLIFCHAYGDWNVRGAIIVV